jgi:peptide/nickel transport system permease protein
MPPSTHVSRQNSPVERRRNTTDTRVSAKDQSEFKGLGKITDRRVAAKKQSQFKEFLRGFFANRVAVVGLVVVIVLMTLAFSAEYIVPYEMAIKQNIREKLASPGEKYPLGTDSLGRDVLARLLHGARVSLTMGFLPTLVSLFFGMTFGALAAYLGGWVENLIMRICDMFACIPGLLLSLTFVAALGPGLRNMLIAITIASIPGRTRFVRAVVLNIVEMEYIEAARSCGTSSMGIIFKHVLPNAMGPLILNAAGGIAGMIMTGAGLSFLGLGIQPPNPEWGCMLAESREYMRSAPHLMFAPGLAILLSILSLNLVGDGLRDALDPKLRR